MNISQYIKKSTGLEVDEINQITLSDRLESIRDKADDDYTVSNPRLIAPRGSVIAFFGRFFPESWVDDYIDKIKYDG